MLGQVARKRSRYREGTLFGVTLKRNVYEFPNKAGSEPHWALREGLLQHLFWRAIGRKACIPVSEDEDSVQTPHDRLLLSLWSCKSTPVPRCHVSR